MFSLWSYRASESKEGVALTHAEFSIARYEPMTRLMSKGDLLFLEAQPGFRGEIRKKFIEERRRIFRLYLGDLAADFHRLHKHARTIAANMPADQAPLIGVLIRQQARFWFEMTALELRLSLDWAGIGSIDPSALVNAIGAMHAEIGRLTAPAAA
jgi:hypothetical protein